jgi:hypothetical protein
MQHAKEFRLHDRETVKGLIVKRSVCVVGVRRKNAITERATTCSTAYKAPTGRRTRLLPRARDVTSPELH